MTKLMKLKSQKRKLIKAEKLNFILRDCMLNELLIVCKNESSRSISLNSFQKSEIKQISPKFKTFHLPSVSPNKRIPKIIIV